MQLEQTALIFVGIPLAVIVIVAGIVYAGSRKGAKRYRPGRPYEYAAVWFTSAQRVAEEYRTGTQAELPGSSAKALAVATAGVPVSAPGVTGGASDRW